MRSNHSADILKWLSEIIKSCETLDQTITASKCLDNFKRNYTITPEYSWKVNILKTILRLKKESLLNEKT